MRPDLDTESASFALLQAQATTDARLCVVSAIVVNADRRAFVMRRSPDRRLFPGCWDIAGGHVDPGETLESALAREIFEETGWRLRQVVALNDVVDWESERDGRVVRRREFNFLVDVDGDLASPRIERDRFTEWRWVGLDEVGILRENRSPGDAVIFDLVRKGLERASRVSDEDVSGERPDA